MNPFRYIRDAIMAVGGGVIIGLILLVFYEGIPLGPLRLIPWVGPALEMMTDGRVERERKAALEGFVLRSELETAKAKNAELTRQIDAGKAALETARQLAEADAIADAETARRTEQEIAVYEAKLIAAGRSCLLKSEDLEFLKR